MEAENIFELIDILTRRIQDRAEISNLPSADYEDRRAAFGGMR